VICSAWVSANVPQLVKALLTSTPEKVCALAGVCDSSAPVLAALGTSVHLLKPQPTIKPAVLASAGTLRDGVDCSICQFVVSYIDGFIAQNQNATDEQIEQAIEKVCNLLGPYSSQCDAIVQDEVPDIVEWLADMTPTEVCQQLNQCSAAIADPSKPLLLRKPAPVLTAALKLKTQKKINKN